MWAPRAQGDEIARTHVPADDVAGDPGAEGDAADDLLRVRLRVLEREFDDVRAQLDQARGARVDAEGRVRALEQSLVRELARRRALIEQVRSVGDGVRAAERRVVALLASRRWRTGVAVGDAADRLLRRPPPDDPAGRVRRQLTHAQDLVRELAATPLPPAEARPPRIDSGSAVDEVLRRAFAEPIIETPFDGPALRALELMASHQRRMAAAPASDAHVSVVMPTYQRAAVVGRAIESVRNQSHDRWELLVIDDGSTDGTEKAVRRHEDPRIRYVRLDANGGVSRARNEGLDRAVGSVVAYLDSDNYWDRDYLTIMLGALAAHRDRESAYCAQYIWDVDPVGSAGHGRRLRGVRFAAFNRSLMENRNYVDLNAFVHRNDIRGGPIRFNEALPRLVDWELILRLSARSRPVAVPCVLSHYEFSTAGDQLTRAHPAADAMRELDRGALHTRPLDPAVCAAGAGAEASLPLFARSEESRAAAVREVTVVAAVSGGVPQATRALERYATADGDRAPRLDLVEASLPLAGLLERAEEHAAGGVDVVVLTDGAVVTPGWLVALQEVVERLPEVGLVVGRRTVLAGSAHLGAHLSGSRYRQRSYRELDVAISPTEDNVVDPLLDDARGFVAISHAHPTCYYLPEHTLRELGPVAHDGVDDARQARRLCDLIRHSLRRRIVYTPHAKVYDLS